MHSIQHSSQDLLALAEEGEAIGTVRQFSSRLNLPESQVLPCLQNHAEQSILLRAGDESEQVLMLDAEGMRTLLSCAAAERVSE
jgi:hypothetical protein